MVFLDFGGVKRPIPSSFSTADCAVNPKSDGTIHNNSTAFVNTKFRPRVSRSLRLDGIDGAHVDLHVIQGDTAPAAEGRALGSGGATFPQAPEGGQGDVAPEQETSSLPSSTSSVPRRWALLHKIQKLCRPDDPDKRGPAVCGCGRPGFETDSINIHLRSGRNGKSVAGVSGVRRCGSPWLCSACSPAKAHERAERVQRAADATYRLGGAIALVVLTASHALKTPLAEIKTLVAGASRKARQGRAWTGIADEHGILGVVVGQEVTVSRTNGWHSHQHLSVLIEPTDLERAMLHLRVEWRASIEKIGPPTRIEAAVTEAMEVDRIGPPSPADVLSIIVRDRAQAAGDAIAERYKAMIRGAGGKVSDEHGCRVRVADDAEDASGYTAKGSMAWEVAGGNKDETKSKDSMTPWDLAESAYQALKADASKVDCWARARWSEYVSTMPGTRSCVVSKSLAATLGIASADDAETGEQVLHEADDVIGRVEASAWSIWMRFGLAAVFLARVESYGEVGCATAIAETAADAERIEAAIVRRRTAKRLAAEKEAERRHDHIRTCLIHEAAARVASSGSAAGTMVRISRAIDAMAAGNPGITPIRPDEVIRALAARG